MPCTAHTTGNRCGVTQISLVAWSCPQYMAQKSDYHSTHTTRNKVRTLVRCWHSPMQDCWYPKSHGTQTFISCVLTTETKSDARNSRLTSRHTSRFSNSNYKHSRKMPRLRTGWVVRLRHRLCLMVCVPRCLTTWIKTHCPLTWLSSPCCLMRWHGIVSMCWQASGYTTPTPSFCIRVGTGVIQAKMQTSVRKPRT